MQYKNFMQKFFFMFVFLDPPALPEVSIGLVLVCPLTPYVSPHLRGDPQNELLTHFPAPCSSRYMQVRPGAWSTPIIRDPYVGTLIWSPQGHHYVKHLVYTLAFCPAVYSLLFSVGIQF